ncbi:M14 family zinc carboxypeptidase [Bacillus sp. Marseille-Q1617]|uniref:M14 family zinc carboxypeptidase n=1 Tax=Bacillus sp. Marseille-Q1617 TaxID=2736887 RepID=UPI00158A7EC4|nr:M14 family zinc carboxypeptidase [Bacillus sp. Marseille-Q1617]
MKNKLLAGIASFTLLASSPLNVLADSPQTVIQNTQLEEKEKSLFNSEHYDFVKYSQIEGKLNALAKESSRISVEKSKTKSALGQDMYVVTVSDPSAKGKFGYYKGLRKKMIKSPDKAQDFIEKHPDLKVPVMINGSIHGTEFVGTDAVLQLIERFATDNDEETKSILEDHILIFNVTANPDGRIGATRFNGNGIDLNRDFITQSQPETEHMVDLITEWNPMVFLDLHGYVKGYGGPSKPGLIEPCTPPHNPNYEYDLYSKWAMGQAEAMEASIVGNKANYENTNTETSKVDYQNMEGTYIPQRDDSAGWDDYPPIFTPMYAMYHGAYGYTLEAPTNDWDGVKWTYDAVMGALNFASENKTEMVKDQIEVFKRGVQFDHPFHKEGHFPSAYILPNDAEDQTATQKAVAHLQDNDITVEEAKKEFTYDGVTYPKGTYIVPMDQAKAGLANTMLWDGEDITEDTPSMYDISAWNLPELWGFQAVEVSSEDQLNVKSNEVRALDSNGEVIGEGPYAIPNSSVESVSLANQLLNKGHTLYRGSDGTLYADSSAKSELQTLVKDSAVTIATKAIPEGAKEVKAQVVTILKDGGINKAQSHAGTKLALERLGFQVVEKTPVQIAEEGLGESDVFIYNGKSNLISYENSTANQEFGLQDAAQYEAFKANVKSFIAEGGNFLAIGAGASQASTKLGLSDVEVKTGGSNSNGIVHLTHGDSTYTAGYNAEDLGFVYQPTWYSNTENKEVLSNYKDSEDFFMAGHWKGRSQAQGRPVMVKDGNVLLIGLEPTFRDHTDYLFRLVSNAIFAESN